MTAVIQIIYILIEIFQVSLSFLPQSTLHLWIPVLKLVLALCVCNEKNLNLLLFPQYTIPSGLQFAYDSSSLYLFHTIFVLLTLYVNKSLPFSVLECPEAIVFGFI